MKKNSGESRIVEHAIQMTDLRRARTALMMAIAIGSRGVGSTVPCSRLVHQLTLSSSHADRIMRALRDAGLACPSRGPNGGYSLTRPPANIRLNEIVQAVSGARSTKACRPGHAAAVAADLVFAELSDHVIKFLGDRTLASVLPPEPTTLKSMPSKGTK